MSEPTKEEFMEFYKEYEEACKNKDAEFLKAILPDDIPQDEFAFVLNMSQQSAMALAKSGVKPKIEQDGNQFNAVYEGDLGDGMTSMIVDFLYEDGKWLKKA
jgi:hypothetical protein